MSWAVAEIPDLTGTTAVVTGANGGLGLETVRGLAGAGAHVVMAARNQEKARAAVESVKGSHPRASVELVEVDLTSLSSIETAGTSIVSAHPTVDILVNNAGVMATPEQKTEDGFEMQLGVNHLGHWAFTAHLMPSILRAGHSRVVTVTSFARLSAKPVDPANPHLTGMYSPWRAYGQSKLANYHFGLGLQRQFDVARVPSASLIAHPGLTNTDLQANTVRQGGAEGSAEFWHRLAVSVGMTPERGALPQLRAATDPDAHGGELYAPRFVMAGAAVRRPILRRIGSHNAIRNLWEVSERETGLAIDLS
jgi:NAD(P)-dependent dehydrogenase (short-subunit alcohol dehydrogenase family)